MLKAKHVAWKFWLFPMLVLTVLILAFAIPTYVNRTDPEGNDIEMRLQSAGFTVLHADVYGKKESISAPNYLSFVRMARLLGVNTVYRWGHDFFFVYEDIAYYLVY